MVVANNTNTDSVILKTDRTETVINTLTQGEINKNKADTLTYKPDPVRVVWMGAIIPGYGQILNRSFWKLPIVYAGFLGCGYAITFNSNRYNIFKRAFSDISDNNVLTTSYMNILPTGYTVENYPGGRAGLQTNLKSFYEQSRRNRDLSIILSLGYYAITIVEAYVEAQLFDFDISPDLSLHIRPALLENNLHTNKKAAGMRLSLNLK